MALTGIKPTKFNAKKKRHDKKKNSTRENAASVII